MANPIVLIHGYSDTGFSFEPWRDALVAGGYDRDNIHICNYRCLIGVQCNRGQYSVIEMFCCCDAPFRLLS